MTPTAIEIGGLGLIVAIFAFARQLGGWENKPLARCLGITAAGLSVAWCFLSFPAWYGWVAGVVVGLICLLFILTWVRKPHLSIEESPAVQGPLSLWSQIAAFWHSKLVDAVLKTGYGVLVTCWIAWAGWLVVSGLYYLNKSDPPSKPTPAFDSQVILPDGRAIISSKVEDLQIAFRNSTMDHFNRLLGGKWMKISGNVRDNLGGGSIMIETEGSSPGIFLDFGKEWEEQLSGLQRGSSVTVRGKMAPVSSNYISLVECELL